MDEIAKDQYFHIDGIKKGTEKDLIEKLYPDVCMNDDGEMVVTLFDCVLAEINTIPHSTKNMVKNAFDWFWQKLHKLCHQVLGQRWSSVGS